MPPTPAIPTPKSKSPTILLCLITLLTLFAHASATHAQTLTHIRATHLLRCATISEIPEYSSTDDHGPRLAFDTDLCRAVAIAILGPAARIALTSYPDDVTAASALRAHRVDLIPTLTLDFTHASDPRLTFSPPVLYDGVGFLVPTSVALTSPAQLSSKKICFLAATQVEPSLRAFFAAQHLDFVPFPFNEEGEMEAAFVTGNCAALAGDLTRLVSVRLNFGPLADRYTLLPSQTPNPAAPEPTSHLPPNPAAPESDPAQISADPLASASSSADPAFANIVRWTLEVLLNAEALHFDQRTAAAINPPIVNLDSHSATRHGSPQSQLHAETPPETPAEDPTLAILTGHTREIGSRLGLANDWAVNVIAAIGNYAELFDRDLGSHSPLQLPRAQNRLSTQNGLMLPLPLK